MIAFTCGIASVLIYYTMLFSWLFWLSKIHPISTAMGNILLLGIALSVFLAGIAIIAGLFKTSKDMKDKLLNRGGVVYGSTTMVIWFFLMLSSLIYILNLATASIEEIKVFRLILTVLSTLPVFLGVVMNKYKKHLFKKA